MGRGADRMPPPTKCSQSTAPDHRPYTVCICRACHLRPLSTSVPRRPKGARTTQSGGGVVEANTLTHTKCSDATLQPVLRIRIEKMRMRIQEKISMRIRMRIRIRMRMRIHALTELWLASKSIRNL